jgi:uncharacterized protein (DUF1330 family)
MAATLFARHRVQDYLKWRAVYDSVGPMQKQHGVTSESVYQTEGDPTDVTVVHNFGSAEQAKAFAESTELREAMATAGVLGVPTIWITSEA